MPDKGKTTMELAELRGRIEEVDRQFAALLARRQELSEEVARCKAREGKPLRNYAVEARVHQRFARLCREAGLREEWGVDLARFLIDRSVERQSMVMDSRSPNGRYRIVVVGGAGNMGAWFCRFFATQGHDVQVCDPAADGSFPSVTLEDSRLLEADAIAVCAPMDRTGDIIEQLIELRPKGVIFDICSLKKNVVPTLDRARRAGLNISSLHPLFGPDVTALYGRIIVLCSLGNEKADRFLREVFAETAATLFECPPRKHDRLISLTLGMSHAINLLFAGALAGSEVSFGKLQKVASTTFDRQLQTTLGVINENLEMYFDIQRQCDHQEMYRLLAETLTKLQSVVSNGEQDEFVDMMQKARTWFESGGGDHGAG